MLPNEFEYPFERDYNDIPEILYWRKNWGLRNEIVNTFRPKDNNEYLYLLETPKDVFTLIKIIVSWMDKNKWEENGNSIWDYDEILPILQRDIINLSIAYVVMKNNPDIYLEFYDSY